ncbi:hypothetical protein FAUST_10724 [Fusarium austroamericanum]|uniref:FAD dependent oxidoreductase domain-containing protein n=1 Tax=Fusarium austroamericanum TaxID=282268 RepID=A0AAN5Z106_FUSAU|nr:hypothetical protein FAUST_10724 [Fusarium austroamericanum]
MAFLPAASLPVPNPTESYWMTQPHPFLEDFCSTENVPKNVDTVIIGSGIAGILIANDLLSRQPGMKIAMLEAREACSGATGRNGGHIKPDCYRSFATFQKLYGTDQAISLCRFEMENMKEFVKFIREQGLAEAIDLVETRSVDFFMNAQSWSEAQESIKLYKEAAGDLPDIEVHGADETETKFGFVKCLGAVSYPACSLWPRKLAMCLLERAVDNGLMLFTKTPVTSVSGESEQDCTIESTKGTIKCHQVYHATNGYVSNLLPEFIGKVVPAKGIVVAVNPDATSLRPPMDHTCGVQWGEDFDYMIQRPSDGRPLIFGGRDLAHPDGLFGPVGDLDDSTTTPEIVKALIEFPTSFMKDWVAELPPRNVWSGIMGFTADEVPFVGNVPGRPGQFVVAGFMGHGMARVFLTIRSLLQLAHSEEVDSRVPKMYFDVEKRLKKPTPAWDEYPIMSTWVSHEDFSSQYGQADLSRSAPCPSEFPEDAAKSQSYWIRNFPIALDDQYASAALPEEVDVAIIGSGITGAVAAFKLSELRPNLRVALLEARGLCTGATGRNGGHLSRPEVYDIRGLAKLHGPEDALRVRQMFLRNRDMTVDCIAQLGAESAVDLRMNGTIVVFETEAERDAFKEDFVFAQKLGHEPECQLLSQDEVLEKLQMDPDTAKYGAAYLAKCGTLYPRKLVNVLLETAVKRMKALTLHPFTPVTSILKEQSESELRYTVHTSKGSLKAKAVLYATNGYSSHIVPSLRGEDGVYGCKAHMIGVQPPATEAPQLNLGFGFADFWHWIQQRPDNGPFLYGLATAELIGDYNDTTTLPNDHPVRQEMYSFLAKAFPQSFPDGVALDHLTYDWTGVQGFTKDGASIVGRPVKGSPGEFASVGHNGEGMAKCFVCASVVTDGILEYLDGKRVLKAPDWFPRAYWRDEAPMGT